MFKVPFQQFARHIDSISKDTLQLKILQTWINIRANSFIKTWVNIIKQRSMKTPETISVTQKPEPGVRKALH